MKRGFSLVELIMVVLIFSFLFGATLTVLSSSDRSWRTGYNKLSEQQEARRLMDKLTRSLRQVRPAWVTISASGSPNRDKILFYEPVFNEGTGEITPGPWIIFKPNPNDITQVLMKKSGDDVWRVAGQDIEKIRFFGGDCPECKCFASLIDCPNCNCANCATVSDACPLIKIEMEAKKENGFSLQSFVTLRNANMLSPEEPEPPPEGEF